MKATEVTAGLAENNGSLLPGLWRDSLHVTCGLTACTPGSAPSPTLGNEYGKTLPFYHNYTLTTMDIMENVGLIWTCTFLNIIMNIVANGFTVTEFVDLWTLRIVHAFIFQEVKVSICIAFCSILLPVLEFMHELICNV